MRNPGRGAGEAAAEAATVILWLLARGGFLAWCGLGRRLSSQILSPRRRAAKTPSLRPPRGPMRGPRRVLALCVATRILPATPGVNGMSQFAPVFLTIHILTAIVAFGPSFAFPLISGLAAKEPQHGPFAIRLIDVMERRMILPAALTMPVSGALLVWSQGINLLGTHWLLTAIALYVVAIVFAFAVQLQTVDRMLEAAHAMAAGAASAAAAAIGAVADAAGFGASPILANLVMTAGPRAATP